MEDKELRIKHNKEKLVGSAKKHKALDIRLAKEALSMSYSELLVVKENLYAISKEITKLIKALKKDGVDITRESLRKEA